MSCYDWERGTITIPSAQWAKFKAAVREGYNNSKQSDFTKAEQLQVKLLALHATYKGNNPKQYGGYWENLLELGWKAVEKPVFDRWGLRSDSEICYEQRWNIEESIFRNGKDKPPLKPLKKGFPLADSSTKSLEQGQASVSFDDKTRGVTWEVDENNRAIDSARATSLGNAFFTALGKIEWTRGSGGNIIGNNEYNRESEYEGGGGNTLNDEYGPEVVKRNKTLDAQLRTNLYTGGASYHFSRW